MSSKAKHEQTFQYLLFQALRSIALIFLSYDLSASWNRRLWGSLEAGEAGEGGNAGSTVPC